MRSQKYSDEERFDDYDCDRKRKIAGERVGVAEVRQGRRLRRRGGLRALAGGEVHDDRGGAGGQREVVAPVRVVVLVDEADRAQRDRSRSCT